MIRPQPRSRPSASIFRGTFCAAKNGSSRIRSLSKTHFVRDIPQRSICITRPSLRPSSRKAFSSKLGKCARMRPADGCGWTGIWPDVTCIEQTQRFVQSGYICSTTSQGCMHLFSQLANCQERDAHFSHWLRDILFLEIRPTPIC